MITESVLLMVCLAYVIVLIAVAWLGERKPGWHNAVHPFIYSMTLAVYCSSWTFFGAVGSASSSYLGFLPIYAGPMLLFFFGKPLFQRLTTIGSRQKTTSIADFIGSRYGKRQSLAAVVSLLAIIGSLPYIALQLKALSLAWDSLAGAPAGSFNPGPRFDDTLFIAAFLAIFAMMFGTHHIENRERNRGMMSALALESIVKILALLLVAAIAVGVLVNLPAIEKETLQPLLEPWSDNPITGRFLTLSLLSMLAIICLPRQFHVTVVEYQGSRDLDMARWVFPVYLLLICLVVPPITIAGQAFFSSTAVPADTYVLQLPMTLDMETVALIVFLGGFSAATGMTIVAVVTLAIMASNEIVLPALLRLGAGDQLRHALYFGRYLRGVRRVCIALILLAAWQMNHYLQNNTGLASIGLLSFACFAQLAPAMLGAIYWRRGHAYGVYAGLTAGFGLWIYCLLLPALGAISDTVLQHGPMGVAWLQPQALLGLRFEDPLTHGVFWSLGANIVLYVAVSLLVRPSGQDNLQAQNFIDGANPLVVDNEMTLSTVQVGRLRMLLESFVSEQQQAQLWNQCENQYEQRLLDDDRAPVFVVEAVENLLSGVVGASSAQRAIQLLQRAEPLKFKDIADIVGGTSQQLEFNNELLRTTVETVSQGISVVDAELKLVAWNQRYEQLFNYPPRLLYVGCPIESVYRYNAERGMYNDESELEAQVSKRLELLRTGGEHQFERKMPNGTYIQVVGRPLENGGFVTTYSDVTEFRAIVAELEEAKQYLETRVMERTRELQQSNEALAEENQLRAEAEQETRELHASKSRVMQAVSHDLMQPVSAAKLFVSSLRFSVEAEQTELIRQLEKIDSSLDSVEYLVSALREIARLESGKITPKISSFSAASLINELAEEFTALGAEKGIVFRAVNNHQWIESDRQMLRRILQNFLSNALHYTRRGKVLLGVRRKKNGLRFEVWDTGSGINSDDMERIFNEFERLNPGSTSADKGLGLGLSIAKRMAELLNHPIDVQSTPGRGSVFSVLVPLGSIVDNVSSSSEALRVDQPFSGIHILCIDNERNILEGMHSLLSSLGCKVSLAATKEEAEQLYDKPAPDFILLDYHLDEKLTGLQLRRGFPDSWQTVPATVVSADNSDTVLAEVSSAGCAFLKKPLQLDKLIDQLRNGIS